MEISIFNTINSDLAINQEDGIKVFEAISKMSPSDLTISFIGLNHVSSSFLNESLGRYAQMFPSKIDLVKFIFPSENEIFHYKVQDVIENALLGDVYNNLVDNALLSL